MSGNKSPRKPYRQKHVANPFAFNVAMQGACNLSSHGQITRAARVRASVDRLIQSVGNVADWRDVFDAVNMIEAFSRQGLVRDARDFLTEQQESIAQAMERQRATRSNVLRPCEVENLRHLAVTWAQVLEVVTCREYFNAEQWVVRKVANALASGGRGCVRVLEAA